MNQQMNELKWQRQMANQRRRNLKIFDLVNKIEKMPHKAYRQIKIDQLRMLVSDEEFKYFGDWLGFRSN